MVSCYMIKKNIFAFESNPDMDSRYNMNELLKYPDFESNPEIDSNPEMDSCYKINEFLIYPDFESNPEMDSRYKMNELLI